MLIIGIGIVASCLITTLAMFLVGPALFYPLFLLVAILLGLLLIKRFTPDHLHSFLSATYVVGLTLRLALAVACYWYLDEETGTPFLLIDDNSYHDAAVAGLAQWTSGGLPGLWNAVSDLPAAGYTFLNAVVYLLAGPDSLAARFLNAWLGALGIVILYRIARRVTGEPYARSAALIYALFPLAIFWSGFQFKDTLSGLLALLALDLWPHGETGRGRGFGYWGRVSLYCSVLAVTVTVRPENLPILLAATLGLSLFLPSENSPRIPVLLRTGVLLLLLGILVTAVVMSFGDIGLAALEQRRVLTLGQVFSSQEPGLSSFLYAQPASLPRTLVLSVAQLAFLLIVPIPSLATPYLRLITPGMLIWYVMLPWWFIGGYYLAKAKRYTAIQILVVEAGILLAMVLTFLLTARHTTQLLPFHAAMVAYGWRVSSRTLRYTVSVSVIVGGTFLAATYLLLKGAL